MKTPRTVTLPVRHAHLVVGLPSFHRSGSITGMKKRFYGMKAQLVRCGQWIYNLSAARDHSEIVKVLHLSH